jgi:hypothetical protein
MAVAYLAELFLQRETFQTNVEEKYQNTRFMFRDFSPKIVPFVRQCGKTWQSRTGHGWQ